VAAVRKQLLRQGVAEASDLMSEKCQDSIRSDCLDLTAIDTRLRVIIDGWSYLSEQERDRVAGYLDALRSLPSEQTNEWRADLNEV
jgi:hypothetical protein